MGWMGSIVILASCEYHFVRVHEHLVQHTSNNINGCNITWILHQIFMFYTKVNSVAG